MLAAPLLPRDRPAMFGGRACVAKGGWDVVGRSEARFPAAILRVLFVCTGSDVLERDAWRHRLAECTRIRWLRRRRAEALRTSVVAKAQRSPSAVAKQTHGTTPDGFPVHSLPNPSRRPRHLGAKHRHHRTRSRSRVRRAYAPNKTPAKGARPPRHQPRYLYPVDPITVRIEGNSAWQARQGEAPQ
jgi:hypothetical protein